MINGVLLSQDDTNNLSDHNNKKVNLISISGQYYFISDTLYLDIKIVNNFKQAIVISLGEWFFSIVRNNYAQVSLEFTSPPSSLIRILDTNRINDMLDFEDVIRKYKYMPKLLSIDDSANIIITKKISVEDIEIIKNKNIHILMHFSNFYYLNKLIDLWGLEQSFFDIIIWNSYPYKYMPYFKYIINLPDLEEHNYYKSKDNTKLKLNKQQSNTLGIIFSNYATCILQPKK